MAAYNNRSALTLERPSSLCPTCRYIQTFQTAHGVQTQACRPSYAYDVDDDGDVYYDCAEDAVIPCL